MTVTSETAVVGPLLGPGTGPYSYAPMDIFADSEIEVTKVNLDDTQVILTLTTHYTVNRTTKEVTLEAASTLLTGEKVILRRKLALTQLKDPKNQGAWNPVEHEEVFDRQSMIAIQQKEELDRAYKVPVGSVFDPAVLVLDTFLARPKLITEVSVAAATNLDCWLDNIGDTYDRLLFELSDIQCVGANDGTDRTLEMHLRIAAAVQVTGHDYAIEVTSSSGARALLQGENQASLVITTASMRRGFSKLSASVEFTSKAAGPRQGSLQGANNDSTTPLMIGYYGGLGTAVAGSIDGFRLAYTAGTGELTGTARLWGLPKT